MRNKGTCLIFASIVVFLLITGTGLIFVGAGALFSNLATARQYAEETATTVANRNATLAAQAPTAAPVRPTFVLRTPFPTPIAGAAQRIQTAAAGTAQAQARSAQATVTARAQWRIILDEPFDSNANNWLTGDRRDDFAAMDMAIANGKYHWEAQARTSFVWSIRPRSMRPVTDFYLTVEALPITGPTDASYGLVFRVVDNSNYYVFRITNDRYFAIQLRYEGELTTLGSWKSSTAIKKGAVNRLTVTAQGSHFTFFINGEYVAEMENNLFSLGDTGVIVGLFRAGDEAVFEFDNFQVRAP